MKLVRTYVDNITVDHGHPTWLEDYKAKTWNVQYGVITWERESSLITSRCYLNCWVRWRDVKRHFPNPSYQYGRFYHGGGWTEGSPRITIYA